MNERILISGASIAGLTLAHWLARHGFQPVVVERHRDVVGASLHVGRAHEPLARDRPDRFEVERVERAVLGLDGTRQPLTLVDQRRHLRPG